MEVFHRDPVQGSGTNTFQIDLVNRSPIESLYDSVQRSCAEISHRDSAKRFSQRSCVEISFGELEQKSCIEIPRGF